MRTVRFGLDMPIDGRFGDPALIIDLAQQAEQAGWDGFFIQDFIYSERPRPILDPIVMLGALAVSTRTIRLGAFMTALPRRTPWKLAREMATLDILSGGRMMMGVGLGFQEEEYTAFGKQIALRARAEMLDEGLELIDRLWQGGPVNFEGKYYQVNVPNFLPRPVQQPRIPIWVSGGWPRRRPFRRAAHWDGIYVMTVNQDTNEFLKPEEVAQIRQTIDAARQAEPGSKTPVEIGMNYGTPVDNRQGAEMVQPFIDAGANWLIELAPDDLDPETYRKRIQAGPPVMARASE